MKAVVKQITIPDGNRVVCISDIHGSLDLLKQLLSKVEYSGDDILILLGDLYTKGEQGHETLKFIIEMSKSPNVHILQGNCDWQEEYLADTEKEWLDSLPHIIESQDYIFVHGGLEPGSLAEQDAETCMKNDAFMEKGLSFKKYVVTGHWPTVSYTHKIPCFNPIIDKENRIISIDGGIVIKDAGQLNAFIIHNGEYSFESVDDFPTVQMEKSQPASGGELNITWLDRFIEVVKNGEEFSLYKHIHSGKTILIPNKSVWIDENGNLCVCDSATDYYLPINEGDVVSIVDNFCGKMLAKKNGILGWVNI